MKNNHQRFRVNLTVVVEDNLPSIIEDNLHSN